MIRSKKYIVITFIIGCFVYLIGNLFYDGFNYETINAFFIDFAFYQLYGFVLGYSNMIFFDYMGRRNWANNSYKKTNYFKHYRIYCFNSYRVVFNTTFNLFSIF